MELTKEDSAIFSRLSMWNGDESCQYANTADSESADYRAMRQREHSRGLYRDHYTSCKEARIDMALFFGVRS
jgi:hypothetical protein